MGNDTFRCGPPPVTVACLCIVWHCIVTIWGGDIRFQPQLEVGTGLDWPLCHVTGAPLRRTKAPLQKWNVLRTLAPWKCCKVFGALVAAVRPVFWGWLKSQLFCIPEFAPWKKILQTPMAQPIKHRQSDFGWRTSLPCILLHFNTWTTVRQTDRQTDILVASSGLQYAAPPKNRSRLLQVRAFYRLPRDSIGCMGDWQVPDGRTISCIGSVGRGGSARNNELGRADAKTTRRETGRNPPEIFECNPAQRHHAASSRAVYRVQRRDETDLCRRVSVSSRHQVLRHWMGPHQKSDASLSNLFF